MKIFTHFFIMDFDLNNLNYEEFKRLKGTSVDVFNKNNKQLPATNLLVAYRLTLRKKAIWIKQDESILLLNPAGSFQKYKNQIIKKEKRICYICLRKIDEEESASIDHVNPKQFNGTNNRKNLRCCCERCNNDKGNMNMETYYNHINDNIVKYDYLDINHIYDLYQMYKEG